MRECSAVECVTLLYARSLCKSHYMRAWRENTLTGGIRRNGSDDIQYHALHARLRAQRGLASEYICTCGAPAAHWAFHPSEITVTRGTDRLLYSLDLFDYVPLCAQCHRALDDDVVSRGTQHKSAKLTEEDVRNIRVLYAAGEVTQSQIADQYNIKQANISSIVLRKTWRHVE